MEQSPHNSTQRPPPERSPGSSTQRGPALSARGPPRGAPSSLSDGQVASGAATARANVHSAPRRTGQNSGDSPRRELSKRELEAQQRQKVHANRHREVLRDRAEIQGQIAERLTKQVQARDNRFENMLQGLAADDGMRAVATDIIREHEVKLGRRQVELYENWDTEVSQRVEHQLVKFMSHRQPSAFPEGLREDLLKSDDPLKTSLRAQQAEDKFHRVARSIIESSPQTSKDTVLRRKQLEQEVEGRTRSRPTLPIELWEQRKHYASPYGYFVQAIAGENEAGYHGARRMGTNAHAMDESDGVVAAGKAKTRFEKNLTPMLVGPLAKRGQAAAFKKDHGGCSAAPMQDHYNIERGNEVSDAEFPVGKRAFPQLRLS